MAEEYMLTSKPRPVYKSQHLQCVHSIIHVLNCYASSAAAKALCFSAIQLSLSVRWHPVRAPQYLCVLSGGNTIKLGTTMLVTWVGFAEKVFKVRSQMSNDFCGVGIHFDSVASRLTCSLYFCLRPLQAGCEITHGGYGLSGIVAIS